MADRSRAGTIVIPSSVGQHFIAIKPLDDSAYYVFPAGRYSVAKYGAVYHLTNGFRRTASTRDTWRCAYYIFAEHTDPSDYNADDFQNVAYPDYTDSNYALRIRSALGGQCFDSRKLYFKVRDFFTLDTGEANKTLSLSESDGAYAFSDTVFSYTSEKINRPGGGSGDDPDFTPGQSSTKRCISFSGGSTVTVSGEWGVDDGFRPSNNAQLHPTSIIGIDVSHIDAVIPDSQTPEGDRNYIPYYG